MHLAGFALNLGGFRISQAVSADQAISNSSTGLRRRRPILGATWEWCTTMLLAAPPPGENVAMVNVNSAPAAVTIRLCCALASL